MPVRSLDDVFLKVPKPEQITDAIKRHDSSYLRGVWKFYETKPPNPFLLPFLKKALQRLKG